MQNGTATLEYSLAVTYKTKHTFNVIFSVIKLNTHDPAIMLLGIYPNKFKLCPHKIMHKDVYSSFIYNCQTWKQP